MQVRVLPRRPSLCPRGPRRDPPKVDDPDSTSGREAAVTLGARRFSYDRPREIVTLHRDYDHAKDAKVAQLVGGV